MGINLAHVVATVALSFRLDILLHLALASTWRHSPWTNNSLPGLALLLSFGGNSSDGASFYPQDLKDFGREAGNVSFADVERDAPGRGYV